MFHIPARIDMHNPYSIEDAARIEKHIKDKLYLDKKLNKFSKQFVALLGLYIALFQGRRYKDEILKMKWSGGTSDVRLALKEKLVWLPKMKNEDKPTYYPLNSKSLWAIMQLKNIVIINSKELIRSDLRDMYSLVLSLVRNNISIGSIKLGIK